MKTRAKKLMLAIVASLAFGFGANAATGLTLNDGDTLTGVYEDYEITIAAGATVTFNGATITHTSGSGRAAIDCAGNATIVLAEGSVNGVTNTVNSCAAIHPATNATLTIRGSGSLDAYSSGDYGAGIGAASARSNANPYPCGNIVIEGGTITAHGGSCGAGVGAAAWSSPCGDITITGNAVVTASSGQYAAAIGASSDSSPCGNITISGNASVTARKDAYQNAAGIGACHSSPCGNIVIDTTGTVDAKGSYSAAIGASYESTGTCGDITIRNGTIFADGGDRCSGIGATFAAESGSILISGGTITAEGETDGAGIGARGATSFITISGGVIDARGGASGAGIGSCNNTTCGDITITEGITRVVALKGMSANASVGAGGGSATVGTVTISPQLVRYDYMDGSIVVFTHGGMEQITPVLTTGGAASWYVEGDDGLQPGAWRSGAIGDLTNTWLKIAVSKPCKVYFRWKVSSEGGYDYLRLYLNGAEQNKISGTQDWAIYSATIESSIDDLKLSYGKDRSTARDNDCGWVKDISVVPFDGTVRTVTVDSNCQDVNSYNVYVVDGYTFEIMPPIARYGYSFLGFFTAADGGEQVTAPCTVTANTTIYAHWAKTLDFDATGSKHNDADAFDPSDDVGWQVEDDGITWHSGAIGDNTNSWARFTLKRPGTLSFKWKVSSEANNDRLRFYVDGVEQSNISGDVDWADVSWTSDDARNHVVEFRYTKDGLKIDGLDCGWVKDVVFTPFEDVLAVNLDLNYDGADAVEPRYVKRGNAFDVDEIPDIPRTGYALLGWFTDAVGGEQVTAIGAVTADTTLHARWVKTGDFEYALDNTNHKGSRNWTLFEKPQDGFEAGTWHTGPIGDNQETWIETSVTGPCTVFFKWKVSSEERFDFLRFYVGEEQKAETSGDKTNQWEMVSCEIAESGFHVVKWLYHKDGSTVRGLDCGWVKDIVVTQGGNPYTVTWMNGNVAVETDENVEPGDTPSYDSAQPTQAATAQYYYDFAGWEPELELVSSNTAYTAVYTATLRSYDVTWQDENGTALATETLYYGTTPEYAGETPTKPATPKFTYTFAGWDPEVASVTGEAAYTATFTPVLRSYTITWLNEDGSTIDTTTVDYGVVPTHAAPTKAETAEYTYTFNGWTPAVASVTGEATYKATFNATKRSYTITWLNEGGAVLASGDVEYGTVPAYGGATPTKAETAEYTYTFAGWDKAVVAVTGAATYTATFNATKRNYTITWLNEGGAVLASGDVEYGTVPAYGGATPTKAETAEYTYTFAGWDKAVVAVTGAATYTATFNATKRSYTITWLNEGGAVLASGDVEYGTVPAYGGATPTKAETAEYTYTFAGWDKTVVAVTGAATYTATFNATKRSYTITWLNDDNSLIDTTTVEYGVTPTHAAPTKAETAEYTYTFAGWTPAVVAVTGAATYTATFEATPKEPEEEFARYVKIGDVEGFNAIANNLATNYVLTADIDLQNVERVPFGEFSGVFDGNGHSVKNISITKGSDTYIGLFSKLNGATIRNLTLAGGRIEGYDNVGGIAGEILGDTLIEDCTVNLVVFGNRYTIGGLVGHAYGGNVTIRRCRGFADVTSRSGESGGLVGVTNSDNLRIEDSYAEGILVARNQTYCGGYNGYSGGLVGLKDRGSLTISNCYHRATMVDNGFNDRQLVGNGDGNATIIGEPTVIDSLPKGGIIAFLADSNGSGTVAYVDGEVVATPDEGSVFIRWEGEIPEGSNFNDVRIKALFGKAVATAEDLQSVGDTGYYVQTADIDMSGVIGFGGIGASGFSGEYDGRAYEIRNLSIDNNVERVGLFRTLRNATLRNIRIVGGTVSGYRFVGALAGLIDRGGALIENCSSTADVNAYIDAGGLVGNAYDATIRRCFAAGDVTSSGSVAGGFLNFCENLVIADCYALGNVNGGNELGGGFIACSEPSTYRTVTVLTNCYSVGAVTVTGSGNVGGFTARDDNRTNYGCYWDKETSGRTTSYGVGVTGLTTAQMKSGVPFEGWDTTVWKFTEGLYPRLRVFIPQYTVTWLDEDGVTVLDEAQVDEFDTPVYGGVTPTKAETAEYTYTFAGWAPAVAAVESNTTYTATYDATLRSYTITWLNDDGTTIDTTTVAYGETPTHADATKAETAEYTYTFAGWSPAVVAVTGAATYTATFDATPKSSGATVDVSTLANGDIVQNGSVLTGTAPNLNLKVAAGATITLDGVSITNSAGDVSALHCLGDATIILAPGSENTVVGPVGRYCNGNAIYVPANSTLTITGSGSLYADSSSSEFRSAAIGAFAYPYNADYIFPCGDIVIEGGTITAKGGVGIGASGNGGYCGDITITGDANVTAIATVNGSAGIGAAGTNGNCGDITISGNAKVTATGNYNAPGIGAADHSTCGDIVIATTGTVMATGNYFAPGIGACGAYEECKCGNITIADTITEVVAQGQNDALGIYTTSPSEFTYGSHLELVTSDGNRRYTLTPVSGGQDGVVDLSTLTGNYTAQDGDVLTGATGYAITIAAGATVTLDGVRITHTSGSERAVIDCAGNATIVLAAGSENFVTNTINECAAIHPAVDATLTIRGSGSLDAYSSGRYGAGIGAASAMSDSNPYPCGNIVIEGGTLTTHGGYCGAGIGAASWSSPCGDITITGDAVVTAVNGQYAACIGAASDKSPCGDITISGNASVTALQGSSQYAAGIGAAYDSSCGNIVIDTTGTIDASGSLSAGIGSSYKGAATCGNITISNGTIAAAGGSGGSGIGATTSADCGDILISGGTIIANGGEYGAGIGTQGASRSITITGGNVTATGSYDSNGNGGAGIGSLFEKTCGDIAISGGTVTATGGAWAAGIGSGYYGTCSNITISAGIVTANVCTSTRDNETDTVAIGAGCRGTCGDILISGGTVVADATNPQSTSYDYNSAIGATYSGTCGDITITDGITSVTATKGATAQQHIGQGDGDATIGTVTISPRLAQTLSNNDLTLTLTPLDVPETVTVTWKNEDGTTLEMDTVAYGATPTYDGETPTKAEDAQYTYTFEGWEPTVVAATADATYTATYTAAKKPVERVIFSEDFEATVLPSCLTMAVRGTFNSAPGIKAGLGTEGSGAFGFGSSTCGSSAFDNYMTTLTLDFGEETYVTRIEFDEMERYGDWGSQGRVLVDGTVVDGLTFTKPRGNTGVADSEFRHTSLTLNRTLTTIALQVYDITTSSEEFIDNLCVYGYGDETVTVTWRNEDGTVLETDENVELGATPTYDGETPTKASTAEYSYAFSGWTPTVSAVTGAATYTAQFNATVNEYVISWDTDGDGEVDDTTTVAYGTVPTHADGSKAADAQYTYTFTGWDSEVASVMGAATYTAQFNATVNEYTISWDTDGNGEVDDTTTVAYGTVPTHADGSKAATAEWTYTFTGWDATPVAVTGPATYSATFNATKNSYMVSWVVEGVTVASGAVEYGETPRYSGDTPTKESTAEYSYTFSGWSPAIEAVEAETTYTATFTPVKRSYTITWANIDGAGAVATSTVEYGQTPTYGGTPTKADDAENTYAFNGWTPSVVAVTDNATYTATFTATPKEPENPDESYDGTETIDGVTWSYTVAGGEATITYAEPAEGDLVIPDTVESDIPVTAIASGAFSGSDVTSVTIGRNVKTIGDAVGVMPDDWNIEENEMFGPAFMDCYDLETFYVAEGNEVFEAIGGCLYYRNTPNDAKTLALYPCGRTNLYFDAGITVTEIGTAACSMCSEFGEITIPASVGRIGVESFYSTMMTKLVVQDGTTNICDRAFCQNPYLMDAEIAGTVKYIGKMVFVHSFFDTEDYDENAIARLVLHEGIEEIDDEAFRFCRRINEVVLPDSLTRLGEYAFCEGEGVKRVVIGNGLETVSEGAFAWCGGLPSLTIGASVKSIENKAFSGCDKLPSLDIPQGVTNIGMSAFSDCETLRTLSLPDTLKTIGSGAFSGCRSLKKLVVPLSVEEIGRGDYDEDLYMDVPGAFAESYALVRIYLPADLRPATEEETNAYLADVFEGRGFDSMDAASRDAIVTWYSDESELNYVTVTFVNGAERTNVQVLDYISTIPSPTKPGYAFAGWWTSEGGMGSLLMKRTSLTRDTTYYAYWIETPVASGDDVPWYAIRSFLDDEEMWMLRSGETALGETSTATLDVTGPCIVSFSCSPAGGAYDEDAVHVYVDGVERDVFGQDDHSWSDRTYEMPQSGAHTVSWVYENVSGDIGGYVYLAGVTVEQAEAHTITFNPRGGAMSESTTRLVVRSVGALPKPRKDYAVFAGWYTAAEGGERIAEDFVVTQNLDLYAHWVDAPFSSGGDRIWLVDDDGSYKSESLDVGETIYAEMTVTGPCRVVFDLKVDTDYWTNNRFEVYVDGEENAGFLNRTSWLSGAIDIEEAGEHVIRWLFEREETGKDGYSNTVALRNIAYGTVYGITFDENYEGGGTQVKDCAGLLGELPVPSRDDYFMFAGWWTQRDGGTQITATTPVTGEATYYAHWASTPFKFQGKWAQGEDGSWLTTAAGSYESCYAQKDVEGPCTVTFQWRVVDADDRMHLYLTHYLNGDYVDSLIETFASANWTEETFTFDSEGTHTLFFEFWTGERINPSRANRFEIKDFRIVGDEPEEPGEFRILVDENDPTTVTGFEGTCPATITAADWPEGVTYISAGFDGCTTLKHLTLPAGLQSIGWRAFQNCTALETVDFSNCSPTLSEIGVWAFCNCTSLRSLDINGNNLVVGHGAFYACSSLAELNLGSGVDTVEEYAFGACKSLATITSAAADVNETAFIGTAYYKSMAFSFIVKEEWGEKMVAGFKGPCPATIAAGDWPEGVEAIYDYAFTYCDELRSVEFPASFSRINAGTFAGCKGLESITFPATNEHEDGLEVGHNAFALCTNLQSVTLRGPLNVSMEAFGGCSSLASVVVEEGVNFWGERLFARTGVRSIVLPENMGDVSAGAFAGNDGDFTVYVPRSVVDNYGLEEGIVESDSYMPRVFGLESEERWAEYGFTYQETTTNLRVVPYGDEPEEPETYTVTWLNWDGTTLATETVAYGATPVYGGETPTKAADAQYTYTFEGWTPSVAAATADATYTATFEATPKAHDPYIDLSTLTEDDYVVQDGDILTGTTLYHVMIADGATITLAGATINNCLSCEGSATIQLADGTENIVRPSGNGYGGIRIGRSDTTLTIVGDTGTLTAIGDRNSPGIGNAGYRGGNIVIAGGVITATGGESAPGIGSADGAVNFEIPCGTIEITGGTVVATGGKYGAGIGGDGGWGTTGDITIGGGIARVVATKGERYGANPISGSGRVDIAANLKRTTSGYTWTLEPMTVADMTWMVVDLHTGAKSYYGYDFDTATNTFNTAEYKTTKMVFRRVPKGEYYVQNGAHLATMANDYYIALFETTKAQYDLMLDPATNVTTSSSTVAKGEVPWTSLRGTTEITPQGVVTNVEGDHAICNLNGLTGLKFDLPTIAMWEVASLAKPTNATATAAWSWFFGPTIDNLAEYAWNDGWTIHEAGLLKPNEWGLYDVYGNVWEWCADGIGSTAMNDQDAFANDWHWNQEPNYEGRDPLSRRCAGGSVCESSEYCNSVIINTARKESGYQYIGFRLAVIVDDETGGGGSGGDEPEPETYTVTWLNWDGTTLATDTVAYGTTPAYGGETPTKADDEQYTYTFEGWTPTVVAATADATYTATYTAVPKLPASVTTGGNAEWTVDVDGSWKSGAITHYQETWVETTVTGPCLVSFQWKVSSESGYDYLHLTVDEEEREPISGDTDWETVTLTFRDSSTHTILWTYVKDSGVSSGEDCGWVKGFTVTHKEFATYTVTWKNYDGTVLAEDTVMEDDMPEYTGTTPTRTKDSDYTYVFSGWTPDIVAAAGNAEYTATFTALPNLPASVTTGGSAEWTVDVDGSWRSGAIMDNQETWVETTVDGSCLVTFQWKTSSEGGCDVLILTVDGDEKARISGVKYDWEEYSLPIPDTGSHVVRWMYAKDYSAESGEDCGWVKDFTVTPKEFATYTVTWKNWDDTVLATESVVEGFVPQYRGETPARETDEEYYYVFAGWTPDIVAADGDAIYTATYNEHQARFEMIMEGTTVTGYKGLVPKHITLADWPEGVTAIDGDVFTGSSALGFYGLESVEIPATVETIGQRAFYSAYGLTNLVFEAGGTQPLEIGFATFAFAYALESVTLPARLTSIHDSGFYQCTKLATVVFEGNRDDVTIGRSAFSGTPYYASLPFRMLTDANGVIYAYEGTVPAVIGLGDWPAGATALDDLGVFSGCATLQDVTIPATITKVGWSSFQSCPALTNVVFAAAAQGDDPAPLEIGKTAFANCEQLASVTLRDGTVSIGDSAFANDPLLADVTFPTGGQEGIAIEDSAFVNTAYGGTLPFKLVKDGGNSVIGYYGTVPATIGVSDWPAGAAGVDAGVFKGCTTLEHITFPSGIKFIGYETFKDCVNLATVNFANSFDSLTTICGYAFSGCTGLETVELDGDGLYVDRCAFQDCTLLTTLTLGPGVSQVDEFAFAYTTRLEAFVNNSSADIDETAFIGSGYYKNMPFSFITRYDGGLTVIGNTGVCPAQINAEDWPAGIVAIYRMSFTFNDDLRAVEFPASLQRIDESAFACCTNLVSITFPEDGSLVIDHNAFALCTKLQNITLRGDLMVCPDAFAGCSSLETVRIEEGVYGLDEGAFARTQVSSIVLPEGMDEVSAHAFAYDDGDFTVYVPRSETSMYGLSNGDVTYEYIPRIFRLETEEGWAQYGLVVKETTTNLRVVPYCRVTLDLAGGTGVATSQLGTGETVNDQFAHPVKAGYTFAGWTSANVAEITSETTWTAIIGSDTGMAAALTATWQAADTPPPTITPDPDNQDEELVVEDVEAESPEKAEEKVEIRPDDSLVQAIREAVEEAYQTFDPVAYAAQYANYFTKTAESTGDGVYSVKVELNPVIVFSEQTVGDNAKNTETLLEVATSDNENQPVEIKSAKPGLYYSMEASNDLTFPSAAGATTRGKAELAVTPNVSIKKPTVMPSGNAVFFRIVVSPKK